MADNVFGGQANVVIAKVTVPFSATIINSSNTTNIFLVDAILNVYDPSKTINGITQFVSGKGYYINAKTDMDLSPWVGPPFPTGGGITLEDGTPIIPED